MSEWSAQTVYLKLIEFDLGLCDVVNLFKFEMNDEITRQQIKLALEDYCRSYEQVAEHEVIVTADRNSDLVVKVAVRCWDANHWWSLYLTMQ